MIDLFVVTVFAQRGMAEVVKTGLEDLSRRGSVKNVQWSDLYTAGLVVPRGVLEEAMKVVEQIKDIGGVRHATIQAVAS